MPNNDDDVLGLTDTTDVADLIPADVFAAQVLDALYAERKFEGLIAGVNVDLTAKAGSVVQVPFMGRRTAQGPISPGGTLTANDSTFGTYPITVQKFGDYDRVQNEVFEDQDVFDVNDFTTNMGKALAERIDNEVYDALEAATPGSTETLAAAGVLTDLYDQIVELKAKMEKLNVKPSHVIIGPDQNAQFLKDTSEGIKLQSITVRDGQVVAVAGLPVINSSLANANTATAGAVQAIIIDRSRAVGEAWGRRPSMTVDRTTEAPSDITRLVAWLRYGTDVMDTNAIGHVKNP